jgi:hypothetical protein
MYNFNGKTKTLQKKTFHREELAKESAGITIDIKQKLTTLKTKFDAISKKFDSEKDETKSSELLDQIIAMNYETVELNDRMMWNQDFKKCIAVLNILLVEGADDLTDEDFSNDDAQEVWKDFFTQASPIKRDSTGLLKK